MTEKDIKLKKGSLRVLSPDGEKEVVGYLAQVPSFFGVIRDGSGWAIIHLPSGFTLCYCDTLKQARFTILNLITMTGWWNRSAEEIIADKNFHRSARNIIHR